MVRKVARVFSVMVTQSIKDLKLGKQDLREISLSFNENLYNRKNWRTQVFSGFSFTSNFLVAGQYDTDACLDICCFNKEKNEDIFTQVNKFIMKMMLNM